MSQRVLLASTRQSLVSYIRLHQLNHELAFNRYIHEGKVEIIENTSYKKLFRKNVHSADLVNRQIFFSGTSRSNEESATRKIERCSYKALAKGLNAFDVVKSSNEVSIVKAITAKAVTWIRNMFRKNIVENEHVTSAVKGFQTKLEHARSEEKRRN